jgi:hypothetical protein
VHPTDAALDRAVAAFRGALRVPFREDAALGGDLSEEARPVIDALAFAIACTADPLALEYREGLAMAALLGRRAALHRATPTVALSLVEAIVAALGAIERAPDPRTVDALRSVTVEGYCAAVEERVRAETTGRAAELLAPVRIAPRVWLVIVAGEHAPDSLTAALDRAGRVLLDSDACACLVHVAAAPSEDLAAELLAFDATARLVGAQCVFTGFDARWRAAALPRIDPAHATIAESFEDGLRRVLAATDLELHATSPMLQRLRRMIGR